MARWSCLSGRETPHNGAGGIFGRTAGHVSLVHVTFWLFKFTRDRNCTFQFKEHAMYSIYDFTNRLSYLVKRRMQFTKTRKIFLQKSNLYLFSAYTYHLTIFNCTKKMLRWAGQVSGLKRIIASGYVPVGKLARCIERKCNGERHLGINISSSNPFV